MPKLDLLQVPGVTAPELHAVRALNRGDASPDQQKRALDFIIRRVARVDESSFALDRDGGERATAFAEGRRNVGIALRTILNLTEQQVAGHAADARTGKRVRKPTERPDG